jgi:hypothetical protein
MLLAGALGIAQRFSPLAFCLAHTIRVFLGPQFF